MGKKAGFESRLASPSGSTGGPMGRNLLYGMSAKAAAEIAAIRHAHTRNPRQSTAGTL